MIAPCGVQNDDGCRRDEGRRRRRSLLFGMVGMLLMESFVTCLRSLNRSKEGKNGGDEEVEENQEE